MLFLIAETLWKTKCDVYLPKMHKDWNVKLDKLVIETWLGDWDKVLKGRNL